MPIPTIRPLSEVGSNTLPVERFRSWGFNKDDAYGQLVEDMRCQRHSLDASNIRYFRDRDSRGRYVRNGMWRAEGRGIRYGQHFGRPAIISIPRGAREHHVLYIDNTLMPRLTFQMDNFTSAPYTTHPSIESFSYSYLTNST